MKKSIFVLSAAVMAMVVLWASAALAAPAAEMVAQADALYVQRADLAKAKAALDLYEQALKADPTSEELATKVAKTAYWVGKHLKDDDDQAAMFERGIKACKAVLKAKPDSLHATYWLGVCYGVYGKAKGISKSLDLVDPIKELMKKVIAKDPAFEGGGAYRVLGRMYFKLPGLFGGDNDKSIEYLVLAVKQGPQHWLSHLYLAETYLDEDQDDKAKALLLQVVKGPPLPGHEPEYAEIKAEAEKLLKEEF